MFSCSKDEGHPQVLSRLPNTPERLKPQAPPNAGAPETVSPEAASLLELELNLPLHNCLPSPIPPHSLFSFNNLGIQCVRKKEIEAAIERKIQLGIDPYNGEALQPA